MKSHRNRSAHGSREPARVPSTDIQAGIVLQDRTGRIVVASQQAARLLGVAEPAALVGRVALFEDGMAIRSDGSAFPPDEQPAAVAFASGRAHPDTVLGLRRPDAPTVWFRVRAEPLMKVGSSVAYLAVSRFIPTVDPNGRRATATSEHSPRPRPSRTRR